MRRNEIKGNLYRQLRKEKKRVSSAHVQSMIGERLLKKIIAIKNHRKGKPKKNICIFLNLLIRPKLR